MKIHKIEKVTFNNRKRELKVRYKNGRTIHLHYSQLKIRRKLNGAGIDPESKGLAFFVQFQSGHSEFVPYDVPLILSRDSDYLFQTEIEELVADIKEQMSEIGMSKKYLARALGTSDMQIQRLLNPAKPNKNFVQLNRIAGILGLNLNVQLEKAA